MILIALLAMGGLGFFFATVLAIASEKLKVYEDPKLTEIFEALPGLNCGACGHAGCHTLAEAIVAQGNLDNLLCPPGGAIVEEEIAKILGIEAGPLIKKRAIIKCGGTKSLAADKAEYHGVQTCTSAELVNGGHKACTYGCLGFGDCVTACPFNAIKIAENGLPAVDEAKCTACGLCVDACPRQIIDLVACSNRIVVACNSTDKAVLVRKNCKVGCIGCMICVKQAPEGYTVENTLAQVNYEKGDQAAEGGIAKCPTKCIVKL